MSEPEPIGVNIPKKDPHLVEWPLLPSGRRWPSTDPDGRLWEFDPVKAAWFRVFPKQQNRWWVMRRRLAAWMQKVWRGLTVPIGNFGFRIMVGAGYLWWRFFLGEYAEGDDLFDAMRDTGVYDLADFD